MNFPVLQVATDAYAAAEGAHCVVVCTEWPEFLNLDPERLKAVMAQPAIVDGRNLLDTSAFSTAGFHVWPTGRAAEGA